MTQLKVLVTDHAWKSLDTERQILAKAGAEIVVAETGDEEELVRLAPQANGILTNWKPVMRKVIEQANQCHSIGRYGVGVDNIDVGSATELGIVVTNVPTYCIEEVADHATALMLAWARKLCLYDRAMQGGRYDLSLGVPLFRVRGKTLGLAGLGKIGRAVCQRAHAFGLRTIAFDPYLSADQVDNEQVQLVSFEELLEQSDFVSIHAPLTPETEKLFDAAAFSRMKKTAFLINTSRGAIVDTHALRDALDQELIAGAGLDVLPQEPPSPEDPLQGHSRVLITPHAAFYSEESLSDLQATAARQMADVLIGKKPANIINTKVLDQGDLRVRFQEE